MKINVVKVSSALSDPIRQRILRMLISHERGESQGWCCTSPAEGVCNCDIVSALSLLQSRVSYHMKELADAGVIKEKSKGKWKYYSLNRETLREYIRQITLDYNL